jgi:hypothetical protein
MRSAASCEAGGVAPGEIVTIFGSSIGPAELVPLSFAEVHRLSTALAGNRMSLRRRVLSVTPAGSCTIRLAQRHCYERLNALRTHYGILRDRPTHGCGQRHARVDLDQAGRRSRYSSGIQTSAVTASAPYSGFSKDINTETRSFTFGGATAPW